MAGFVPPTEFEPGYLYRIFEEYTVLLKQEWNLIGDMQRHSDDNRKLEQCIPKKRKYDDDRTQLKNAIRRYDESQSQTEK
jgi:hypothetical protein